MDALGREHPQPAGAARESLGVLGPDARGVDDVASLGGDLLAGLEVLEDGAVNTAPRVLRELDDLGAARGVGAVARGGPDEGRDEARVIDARVPVAQRADGGVVAQVGEQAVHALAAEVAVPRHRALAGGEGRERVVQGDAGADIGALPDLVLERVQERDRLDEVRGELVDEEVALGERLLDQVEVEHLQVAQATVHELRGTARRAGGPVLRLDDRGAQAAGHGVERDAGAGHAAADDQDVERGGRALAERLERGLTGAGGQTG